MKLKKICEICGKEFDEKPRKTNRFCSVECYHTAMRKGLYKYVTDSRIIHRYKCSYCGADVIGSKRKKRNGEDADHIFCNRDCYDKYRRLNSERNCKYCGKIFIAIRDKKNAQFCNDTCRRAYFAQQTLTPCVICGQMFYPWVYEPSRDTILLDISVKTCSSKCRKKYHEQQELVRRDKISKAFTGEKHPNWEGGTTCYRGENWHRQRRLCLIRDNYTCQKCGLKKHKTKDNCKRIEVHHKIPYLFFNGDYEKANDLSNLITLCHKCHAEEEWKFRKENKNEYQKHISFKKELQSFRHRSGN